MGRNEERIDTAAEMRDSEEIAAAEMNSAEDAARR